MSVSCSFCSVWVLGGGLSLPPGDGKWGAVPWPRPFCFYVLLADGNDRATPPSKDGCLWWVGVGGGSYLRPERCHSPSLPPAQLCHVSLQASANSLGSRGDQAHSAEGRVQQCVSPRAHVTVWMGRGAGLPGESQTRFLDQRLALRTEGAAPRCSAPTSGPCCYTWGP